MTYTDAHKQLILCREIESRLKRRNDPAYVAAGIRRAIRESIAMIRQLRRPRP